MAVRRTAFLHAAFVALLGLNAWASPVAPRLDPAFGDAGSARVGLVSSGGEEHGVATLVQADGRVVVGGHLSAPWWRDHGSFLLRYLPNGELDPDFGTAGLVPTTTEGMGPVAASQLEQTADGKLLVGGVQCIFAVCRYHLRRFSSAGVPDSSFAQGGRTTTAVTDEGKTFFIQQPNEKILVVSGRRTDASLESSAFELLLSRFDASGLPDSGYGSSGSMVVSGLPAGMRLVAVTAQNGGRLVALAGSAVGTGDFALIYLQANGLLDLTIGRGGVVSGSDIAASDEFADALRADLSGRVVLLGHRMNALTGLAEGRLWRLNGSGQLDPEFGDRGTVRYTLPGGGATADQRLSQDGNALVISRTVFGSPIAMLRFLENGQPDPAFGNAGIMQASLLNYASFFSAAMAAAPGGRTILVGTAVKAIDSGTLLPVQQDVAILAVNRDGSIHRAQGRSDGWQIWNSPTLSDDSTSTLWLDASGKTLVSGSSVSEQIRSFFIASLDSKGKPDAGFGSNSRLQIMDFAGCGDRPRVVVSPPETVNFVVISASGTRCQVPGTVAFRFDLSGNPMAGFEPAFADGGRGFDFALTAAAGGKLLHASRSWVDGSDAMLLQQRQPDGTLDASFGYGGRLAAPLLPGGGESWAGLVTQADARIVWAYASSGRVRLHRFTATGILDGAFGDSGAVSIDLSGQTGRSHSDFQLFALSGERVLLAMLVVTDSGPDKRSGLRLLELDTQGRVVRDREFFASEDPDVANRFRVAPLADGSVLVARRHRSYAQESGRVTFSRLTPELNGDSSFASAGEFELDGIREMEALAVDQEGRAVLAGQDGKGALLQRYVLEAAVVPVSIVEFYNTGLKHYFVTGSAGEIASIESGGAGPGWQRTGFSFLAYSPEMGVAPGARPVCRFYGTTGLGPNSHFYTVDSGECELVKQDPGWTYEGIAFYVFPPVDGSCAPGALPVYRAYNLGFARNDSNHRYVTDAAVYGQMQAQGWAGEGIRLCAAQ